MARTLRNTTIQDTMDAPTVFGAPGNGGLLVARPGNNSLVPWCSVPEGFYALVTSNNAEIHYNDGEKTSPVWPSGYFFSSPFTKVFALITKQTVIFDAPVKGCKTADNVTVQIDVSVAFRIMGDEKRGEDPELVRKFVHQVTPAGLESQLKDALAEEIRTLARSLKHTQVYACRTGAASSLGVIVAVAGAGDGNDEGKKTYNEEDEADMVGKDVTAEMKARLNEQFERQGVQISDVMIQDVVLPKDIVTNMMNKSLVRSKQEYEMMEQQFEMQAITLGNDLNAKKVGFMEQQEKERVEGARDVQAAKDKLLERKAVGERTLRDYREHTNAEVKTLQAETNETCNKLYYDKKRALQKLSLAAEEEAAQLKASAEAEVKEKNAEADLGVAKHNSNAVLTIAEADSAADKMLKKWYELALLDRQLDVYESLVNNDNVLVSGTKDGSVETILLADAVMASSSKNNTHEKLVAELNLMRLASSAYGIPKDGSTYVPAAL